jgi:hypothetical protein
LKASDHLSKETFHEFWGLLDFTPGDAHSIDFVNSGGAVGLEKTEGTAEGHEGRDQSEDGFVAAGIEGGELDDAAIDKPDIVIVEGDGLAFTEGLKSSSVVASFEEGFQEGEVGTIDRGGRIHEVL